jgi:hypothetical protein
LLPAAAHAQGTQLGIKFGLAGVNADRSGNRGEVFILPWIGLYLDVYSGSLLGVRPEFNFVNHGIRVDRTSGNDDIERAFDHALARYVELPVLLRVTPFRGKLSVRPHLVVGPTISRLVDCWDRFQMQLVGATEPLEAAFPCNSRAGVSNGVRFPIAGWMLSIEAGAGLTLPLGRLAGLVEIRHQRGLTTLQAGSKPALRTIRWSGVVGVAVSLR